MQISGETRRKIAATFRDSQIALEIM